ncbi:DUF4430 domain-containing protein [Virgibacillus dakarensis]|nr:DUF4430 domain-containing protein [Virgibacillus dakarensis]
MKKWLLYLVSFVVIGSVLGGCGTGEESSEKAATNDKQTEQQSGDQAATEKNEEMVTITISKDKETEYIDEKKIPIEDGAVLIDVMEDNFAIETDYDGGFITSIEGVAPKKDEQKAWMVFVNGEMTSKGVKDIKLSPGDNVSFDLQAWE